MSEDEFDRHLYRLENEAREKKMTPRMNEEKAIVELKKVREYYSMNRQGYDNVIKWLEGRIKRRSKK